MKPNQFSVFLAVVAMGSLLSSSPAIAHGDEHAANKTAAVKQEQKPWGIAGNVKAAKRVINIVMTDNMRFTPEKIEVRAMTVYLAAKRALVWAMLWKTEKMMPSAKRIARWPSNSTEFRVRNNHPRTVTVVKRKADAMANRQQKISTPIPVGACTL